MERTFVVRKSEFQIIVKAIDDDILIEIRKKGEDEQDFKVKCHIFLLDGDRREIISSCDFFLFDYKSTENSVWHFPSFLKKSFLTDRKQVNRCTLKFDFCFSIFMLVEEYIEETKYIYHSSERLVIESLKDDMNSMLSNDKYADLKLQVSGKEVITAHKAVLASRSPVFSAMFDHQDMTENQTGEIEITDIDADTMKLFLQFLYTGVLDELDSERMLDLLLAAEKYQVPSLKEKCSEYLTLHLKADNICDVVSVADMVGHELLKTTAINYIKENASSILGSPNWPKWIKKNVELGSEILCKVSQNIETAS